MPRAPKQRKASMGLRLRMPINSGKAEDNVLMDQNIAE